jgi:nitrogen-specific signal transduction histidine kinase
MKIDRNTIDLMGALGEGVIVLDSSMNIITGNRAAEKITGAGLSRRKGAALRELLEERNRPLLEIIENAVAGRELCRSRVVIYNRGNRNGTLHLTVISRGNGPHRPAALHYIVMNDLTELWRLHHQHKSLLLQFRRSYSWQIENLRQVAESIAHEVRNPIVTIGGYANLLLKKISGDDGKNGEIRKHLTYIKSNADRLNSLVTQVEKYSDVSDLSLKKENIVTLVREVIRYGQRFAKRQGIELNIQDIDTREYHAFFDRDKMRLALYNLMKHSILLTKKGSPLMMHIQFAHYELCITFEIRTDLPKEEVTFLFNPFYSLQNRELNFDLAVAQRITMLHGGVIDPSWHPLGILTLRLCIPKEKRLERT